MASCASSEGHRCDQPERRPPAGLPGRGPSPLRDEASLMITCEFAKSDRQTDRQLTPDLHRAAHSTHILEGQSRGINKVKFPHVHPPLPQAV